MKPDTQILVAQGYDKRSGRYFKQLECVVDGRKIRARQDYTRADLERSTPEFWVSEEKRILAKLQEIVSALRA